MLVYSRLEWHSLQVPESVCWLVVRKRGKVFCDSAERHHSRLQLHLGQLLRSQRGLIDVYERLLPLVINIHVSPCQLPLLPPEWRKIHLSARLSILIKVDSWPQSGIDQSPRWNNPRQSLFSPPRSTV